MLFAGFGRILDWVCTKGSDPFVHRYALGATQIGGLAWASLSGILAPSVLVTDEELQEAKDHLWSEFRIVVEPSAATTIAALRSGKYIPGAGERVGVLLCGANTAIQ